ncbi:MAG: dTDP-4-dehydrorhamnose reductase [Thermoleophilales bacterium]|jgi:dTDP-4-dehydrorhamnose reductase|nr:dTDP-4-dehydrorhamnose reductase [Thermoleophilales bacterium]
MKILVTGASGMLGRDVVRAAEFVNHEVVAATHADLDITRPRAVRDVLRAERPDAIINCAAYTKVDAAETDEARAAEINGAGAGIVAAEAADIGAAIVHPSTDYVFDGTKRVPYVESDPTNPMSAYGRTKLSGEREVAAATDRHYIVRSSWLFGAGGGNFVETMLKLAGDLSQIVVVRDQIGSPTYTGHLADALVRLLDQESYGIHHIAGSNECSWYEFAVEIFRQAGVDVSVFSCTTEEFPRPAPRPAYSVLGTERDYPIVLPDWQEGLASYLTERAALR